MNPRLHHRRLRWLGFAPAALLLASCTNPASSTGAAPGIVAAGALEASGSCEALLTYLSGEATDRVGAYGLDGGEMYYPAAERVAESASGAALNDATADAAPTTTGGAHSETNTVEVGVDEADTMKTDGRSVFVLSAQGLSVLDATSGELEGRLQLDGYATSMLVYGDKVLIAGTANGTPGRLVPRDGGAATALWYVDVADRSRPRLEQQLVTDGELMSLREHGGIARAVVSAHPELPFVYPSGPASEKSAIAMNKQVIADATERDWMPSFALLDDGGRTTDSGALVDCDSVFHPETFAGFSTTAVVSIDLGTGLDAFSSTAIVADGQRVYMTPGALYVAIADANYRAPVATTMIDRVVERLSPGAQADSAGAPAAQERTQLHKFGLSGRTATYKATGAVSGLVPNDFSMSESGEVLRVATIATGPTAAGWTTESLVTTMVTKDDQLMVLDQLGGLGKGEQIYSVRFAGPLVYVVTFRQTDPLYVVDLTTPDDLVVAGELKINGFSSYLHPISETLLLGVGQDADDNGRVTGSQLSLFDVTDPANPKRVSQLSLPPGQSDVAWDHHAFLYWPRTEQAFVPFTSWSDSGATSGALVVSTTGAQLRTDGLLSSTVDSCAPNAAATPIIAAGAPGETTTTAPSASPASPCQSWAVAVSRVTIAGAKVFALAGDEVLIADLASLEITGRTRLF